MNFLKKSFLVSVGLIICNFVQIKAFDMEIWNRSKKPIYFSISTNLDERSLWRTINPDKVAYFDDSVLGGFTQNKNQFTFGLTGNEPKKNSKYSFYTFKKPFKDIYLEYTADGKVIPQKGSFFTKKTEHGRSTSNAVTDLKKEAVIEDRIFTK
ncbi:hypothetical protein M1446_04270 [Candidatus Dependentiae bacterium]|nr:hypothetical protein [Candidatus Dependentiae bacterium]